MQDVNNEFSLSRVENNTWNLHQVYSGKFQHDKKVRQPGEPLSSTFGFENIGEEQAMQFILTAVDCDISEITMEINNHKEIRIPGVLKKGNIIKYTGGDKAILYDKYWIPIKEIEMNSSNFSVQSGKHLLSFDCKFGNVGEEAGAKLEVRTYGKGEKIGFN